MLVDVLKHCAEGLLDPADGLNKRIAQINAAKGTRAVPVRKFETDEYPLPTQMAAFPVVVQPLAFGEVGHLSQNKRNSKWRVEWHWWDTGANPDYAAVAVVVDAMAVVADKLSCRGPIINIDEMRVEVGGFEGQNRFYTVMKFGFRVHERDEFADLDAP